jgi:hypothetical protein
MAADRTLLLAVTLFAAPGLFAPGLFAQDVLVFADGERLVGKLLRASGATATFKSDAIGEVTVDWSKVKELESKQSFAVLPKNVQLKRNSDISKIPEGTIAVADQKITVTPAVGAPQTVAVADADHLVDKATFDNAMQHNPGFFHDWGGTITGGASLVESTQQSRAFNTAINLVRTVPDEDWLIRRNRTTVQFNSTYGTLSQPNTPLVKTNIFHGGFERDQYLSPAWFAFAQAGFDHSYSQGLSLQQLYGGGIGWSAMRRPNETLDFKASVTYVRQSFNVASSDEHLIGSAFEEDYQRGLRRGIKFTEQLIVIPAWNNTNAISAAANALLTIPVYKRMNFSLGVTDNFLNNPPPGFKKNSFQTNLGITYALR